MLAFILIAVIILVFAFLRPFTSRRGSAAAGTGAVPIASDSHAAPVSSIGGTTSNSGGGSCSGETGFWSSLFDDDGRFGSWISTFDEGGLIGSWQGTISSMTESDDSGSDGCGDGGGDGGGGGGD